MTASAIRPGIHLVVLVAMLAICAGAAVWPASAQERKAINGSPASQVSRDAVGTWFWTQGVAIPNPAGGDPIVLPFEVLGVPSIMRLSPDGGVTDLCGVVHPASRGATYELPFGVLRAVLAEAAIVVERGDCLASAEVCRLRGALHEVDGRLEESENCHRQALSIAREQSALTWELRAATSLARLLGAQDRVAEARQLLAGVCARFTEGRDTSDFREAAGILASWRERER
jgi:hypothetical protein